MKEYLSQTYDKSGLKSALEQLRAAPLPDTDLVPLYDELLRHAYWQAKDLPAAIEIGQAGIRRGEALAEQFPEAAEVILAQVKAIYYDLASFTWPGWDEEGFTITAEQVKLGLECARQNLDLAAKLKKTPLPVCRAYWMLGAQQLAVGEHLQAQARFSMAEKSALEADSAPDALLAAGFVQLAALLADPENAEAESKLAEIKTALLKEEHGEMFVKQLEDALRVFGESEL